MYTTLISVSEQSLTTRIMEIQRVYLECGIQIQSDSKFSRHAIYDCSLGQYKHILQFGHRSKVNIYPPESFVTKYSYIWSFKSRF